MTVIVTTRSTAVHAVLSRPGRAYQHTPDSGYTSPVGSIDGSGPAPQARVIGGSPYAAFCSGPAGTGRRRRSRRESGRAASNARHTVAVCGDRFGAAIATGPVAWALGDGAGRAAGPPRIRKARIPARTATGSAITAANRAAVRVT